jgi:hypothetical protein
MKMGSPNFVDSSSFHKPSSGSTTSKEIFIDHGSILNPKQPLGSSAKPKSSRSKRLHL